MKLAILTSNHLRHRYFANTLIEQFEVVVLLQEEKKRDPSKKGEGTELGPIVAEYFNDRMRSEEFFFAKHTSINGFDQSLIHNVDAGMINDPALLKLLTNADPDYIAVFGSSILGEDIINAFPNRIINMHLGLSPYYRGSGTNFWPLYDKKPEYVGVTIHYLDAGIDTGKMIIQGRPTIEIGDTPHSIGNKTIMVGADQMAKVLHYFSDGGTIEGVIQDHSIGNLCLFKDCTPKHIEELVNLFQDDYIEQYLARVKRKVVDDVVIIDETSW